MNRHTKGPLAYDPATGDIVRIDNDVMPRVAWIDDNCSKKQRDADGRLFAAAPQMLAALDKIIHIGATDYGPAACSRMIDAARAAALAARGVTL